MRRLWILISNISQVLEPSPQGVLRVVIFKVLVGRRTGPLTRRSLDLARSMSSWQTFSREATLREVRVMRILWVFYSQNISWVALEGAKMQQVKGNAQGPRRTPSLASGKTW